MAPEKFASDAALIRKVAWEASEEPDAVARHPEVITVVAALADDADLPALFGSNGHDPAAFVKALAEGLEPYRVQPLTDAPELVEGLATLATALEGNPLADDH
jgi:hypothetical protein